MKSQLSDRDHDQTTFNMPIDCITARICDYPLNLKLNLGFDVLFNCTTNLPIAIATPQIT
jgi:hypothetical protein